MFSILRGYITFSFWNLFSIDMFYPILHVNEVEVEVPAFMVS